MVPSKNRVFFVMPSGSTQPLRVYMDANATTPLLPEVVEAMRPYWIEHFGNDVASIMTGRCPSGGITLGPALTFGYVAACHAGGVPLANNRSAAA